jgi:hypothetical protein
MATVRLNGFLRILNNNIKCRYYHGSSICQADKTNVNENDATSHYDIVISGMGMVGGAFACVLGQDELFRNLKIAIVESADEKKGYHMPHVHSNRVSALNQNSVGLLKSNYNSVKQKEFSCNNKLCTIFFLSKDLGAFDFIENNRHCRVKQMQVSP